VDVITADHPQVPQVRTNPMAIRTRTPGSSVAAVCIDESTLTTSLSLVVPQENKKGGKSAATDGAYPILSTITSATVRHPKFAGMIAILPIVTPGLPRKSRIFETIARLPKMSRMIIAIPPIMIPGPPRIFENHRETSQNVSNNYNTANYDTRVPMNVCLLFTFTVYSKSPGC
jgi:hypothetical protein